MALGTLGLEPLASLNLGIVTHQRDRPLGWNAAGGQLAGPLGVLLGIGHGHLKTFGIGALVVGPPGLVRQRQAPAIRSEWPPTYLVSE